MPALAAPVGSSPRRSLVLAGGGMRVAYQAGVLRALEEEGLTFAHADGTSGGTMNLAMLLSGRSPSEMCERWRTLDVRQFVSMLPVRKYLRSLDWPGFGDADGLRQRVYPHLGIDVDRINAARGIEGTFNVCDYTTKTNNAVAHTDVDLDLLVAGVSLPIFMPPVEHDGALYVDSVWIKDANLAEAVRRGAEEIWLVWCIGNSAVYRDGAFNQYVHMIELSANGGLFEEFARLRALRGADAPRLHVIKPEFPLPLDPDYYFGRVDAAALLAFGYRDAKRYLAHRSDEGIPYNTDATRMREPRPGAAFRDSLRGTMTLHGRPQALSLEVRVDIRDVEDFLAGPNRTAELVGVVDSDELGRCRPATSGAFSLGGGRFRYELVVDDLTLVADVPARPGTRAQLTVTSGGTRVGGGRLANGLGSQLARLRSLHSTGPGSVAARAAARFRLLALLARGG